MTGHTVRRNGVKCAVEFKRGRPVTKAPTQRTLSTARREKSAQKQEKRDLRAIRYDAMRREKEMLKFEREEQRAKERMEKELARQEEREKKRIHYDAIRREKEMLKFEKEEQREAEKLEKERLAKEQQERIEKEWLEKERLAKEKEERIEKERLEKERLAKEKQERIERERLEKERLAKEKAAKLEKEWLDKERSKPPAEYKLVYNSVSRSDSLRYAMIVLCVPFEEEIIDSSQYKHIPVSGAVMIHKSGEITRSVTAALRYISTKHTSRNFPYSQNEQATIDVLYDETQTFRREISSSKGKETDRVIEENLGQWETALKEISGVGFFGTLLTAADFELVALTKFLLSNITAQRLAAFPSIASLHDSVVNSARVTEYYQARKSRPPGCKPLTTIPAPRKPKNKLSYRDDTSTADNGSSTDTSGAEW